ncbi:MAG: O-antigen ligase family protein [Sulfuriferula sp.]
METPRKPVTASGLRLQPSTLIVGGAFFSAILLGIVVSIFTGLAGDHLGLLLALPGALLLLLLFLFSRNFLFLLVILFRSVLDPVFNTTKFPIGGGIGIGVGGVVNALVIGIALIAIFQQPFPALRELKNTWGFFLAAVVTAIFGSPVLGEAIKMNVNILSYAAIFILPFFLVKSREDYGKWIRVVLWSALIPVLYAFFELATGHGFSSEGAEGFRIGSTFAHPNIFAFYLVLMISLAFSIYKGNLVVLSPRVRRLFPIFILVLLVLLLLTKTRSAWAACFAFFFFYALLQERRMLLPVLLLPLLALAVPEFRDRITALTTGNERILYEKLNSYAWRKVMWTSGLEWMEPAKYLLGYGLGSFKYYAPIFFPWRGETEFGAHSVYVQIIFEAGAAGFLSLIWLLVSVLRRLKALFAVDRATALMMVLLIMEYVFVSYSDNVLDYLSFNWYFWFVIGLACALAAIERAKKSSEGDLPSYASSSKVRMLNK